MVFHCSLSASFLNSLGLFSVSQLCYGLDGFISSSYLQFIKPQFQVLKDNSKCPSATFMFHIFSSLSKSRYLRIFLLSFTRTQWPAGTVKSTRYTFFFFIRTRSCLLIIIIIIYFTPSESFTWVLVTANIFMSPGLFSVFWPISTFLWSI